jgi:hypothetical protein
MSAAPSNGFAGRVPSAEKLCGLLLKIAETGRNSAGFTLKSDSEKVSC